jgi:hypothetical protein
MFTNLSNTSKTIENLIEKLETNFDGIQDILSEIAKSKIILSTKIAQFKTMYTDLVKNNQTKIFLFCLDSLYFQYKSSMMDLEALEQNRKFIMNRMYCDYYKLYHIIVLELNEKKMLQIEPKTYPQYKDLDVLFEYNPESVKNLHADILLILHKLYEKFKTNQLNVQEHVDTKKSVLSISNFLNTLKFDNGQLESQLHLYINYMAFFQFSQKKMLVRLYSKMRDFNTDIDEYLNFNTVVSIDDISTIGGESVLDEESSLADSGIQESNIKTEIFEFSSVYPQEKLIKINSIDTTDTINTLDSEDLTENDSSFMVGDITITSPSSK